MIDEFEKEFKEALPIATQYASTAKTVLSSAKMSRHSRAKQLLVCATLYL